MPELSVTTWCRRGSGPPFDVIGEHALTAGWAAHLGSVPRPQVAGELAESPNAEGHFAQNQNRYGL